jgi:hypothetical protein
MRKIFAVPLVGLLLAQPLLAQEEAPPSLMERGAQMFLDGLREEMAPALDDMAALLQEAGPAMQDFLKHMGPKLREVMTQVEDWSVYEAPEVLENGDIIIRRKPQDIPEEPTSPFAQDMPQIDL